MVLRAAWSAPVSAPVLSRSGVDGHVGLEVCCHRVAVRQGPLPVERSAPGVEHRVGRSPQVAVASAHAAPARMIINDGGPVDDVHGVRQCGEGHGRYVALLLWVFVVRAWWVLSGSSARHAYGM